MTALGASIGRRVFFDKGAYQVFPNFCVMLIAPSGRCRKTSAANLGVNLFQQAAGNLIADKTTPEALVDALKDNAVALLYAPELAVFLGKQKYQEGMIPLLTSLLECPKEWTTKTIGRGATTLMNVGLSALMCSTLDWLQTAIPPDAFGGGFMSRFLFVVQENTPRCFPLPPALSKETRTKLIQGLLHLHKRKGQVTMTKAAEAWYTEWYKKQIYDKQTPGDRLFAGYFERKPDHVLRIAIALRVSVDAESLALNDVDLVQASRILAWLEGWLPATFDQLTASAAGEDNSRIIRQLRMHGGMMEHSTLLRRNSSRMNAEQFKRAVGTLREAGLVEWDAQKRTYYLSVEGWKT
jgi:hypothetical protein